MQLTITPNYSLSVGISFSSVPAISFSFPSTTSSSTTSSGSASPPPFWLEVSSPVRLSKFGSMSVAVSTTGGSVIFSASDVPPSSPGFSDSSMPDVVSRTSKFSPASTSRPSPTCLSRFPRLPPVRQGRVNRAGVRTYTANKLSHFGDQDIMFLNKYCPKRCCIRVSQ